MHRNTHTHTHTNAKMGARSHRQARARESCRLSFSLLPPLMHCLPHTANRLPASPLPATLPPSPAMPSPQAPKQQEVADPSWSSLSPRPGCRARRVTLSRAPSGAAARGGKAGDKHLSAEPQQVAVAFSPAWDRAGMVSLLRTVASSAEIRDRPRQPHLRRQSAEPSPSFRAGTEGT